MVNNIKFNQILPSLSPARKVVRTDSRGRHNRGKPFKESLERKQKKNEKENDANAKQPESEISVRIVPPKRPADSRIDDRCSHANKSVRSKLIDIRV
jgi:hypothetical protein